METNISFKIVNFDVTIILGSRRGAKLRRVHTLDIDPVLFERLGHMRNVI